MKNRLITTNIKSLYSSDEENILLGEWCALDNKNIKLTKLNYKKVNYHFNKANKLQNDFQYLNNLYPKLIISLTKFLNNYHKTKYSKRYWEIIVGPTLVQLLSVFWDRWELIKNVLENYDINNVPIIEYEPSDYISQDFNDIFTNKLDSHFWNNCVFSEIIEGSFKLNISKIKNKYFKNESFLINQDLESGHKFKILDKILSKFIIPKDILIYKLNLGKLNFFKYIFFQKKLSRSFSEFSKKIKINFRKINRNSNLDFEITNDFEKMFKVNLQKNYVNKNSVKKNDINISNTKKILKIFKNNFNLKFSSLNNKKFIKQLKLNHYPKWDSLAHAKLLGSIEKSFKIKLDENNISNFSSFEGTLSYINKI